MVARLNDWQRLRQRLLRIPLVYKILIVNLLVVTFGAVAGTIITVCMCSFSRKMCTTN